MRTRSLRGLHNRGEGNVRAVLTEARVAQIRRILAGDDCPPQRELARMFGVSQATISDIHAGRTWPGVRAALDPAEDLR